MENFDKKNCEGYYDPTPYKAVKNMIKPGEIWLFKKKDNTEAEVLVVAFSDDIATILFMMDECKDGCVEVVGTDVKWVNPRMFNWSWGCYLSRCVRKLSEREFDQVILGIENVLSVKVGKKLDSTEESPAVERAASREVESMKAELDSLRCHLKESELKTVALSDQLSMTQIENTKQKAQNATLKEMYSDLMEKFLQRA